MIAVLGGLIVLAAAMLLYLASPNQQLVRFEMPGRVLAAAGLAGLVTGLACILQWAGPVATVFIVLTLVMLVWSVVPVAVAWRRGVPEGKG